MPLPIGVGRQSHAIDSRRDSIIVDVFSHVLKPQHVKRLTLVLYGGSKDFAKEKAHAFCVELVRNRAEDASAVFDYTGMSPLTRHEYSATGLSTRYHDGERVLEFLRSRFTRAKIVIIGISMGGYLAARLATHSPDGIALIAPAAYAKVLEAEEVTFGPVFTEILRSDASWANSPSFGNVHGYFGKLLVIQFGCDEVIPEEIPNRYFQNLTSGKKSLVFFPNFTHRGNVFQESSAFEDPKSNASQVMKALRDFIREV